MPGWYWAFVITYRIRSKKSARIEPIEDNIDPLTTIAYLLSDYGNVLRRRKNPCVYGDE